GSWADRGAELERLEAGGAGRGVGELGVAQADAARRVDQHIGHGREPQAELVGLHGGGGAAIGEQLELLAHPVLGLAARTVEVLVKRARLPGEAGASERGDDEARIGALQRVLGLADDPPIAAPAVARAIAEVAERPRRLARFLALAYHLGQPLDRMLFQAAVVLLAEYVV